MSSSKPESQKDSVAGSKEPAKSKQSDRLAAALRDNLKRRKTQARARKEPGPGRHEG
jgi:hypothetical protein